MFGGTFTRKAMIALFVEGDTCHQPMHKSVICTGLPLKLAGPRRDYPVDAVVTNCPLLPWWVRRPISSTPKLAGLSTDHDTPPTTFK